MIPDHGGELKAVELGHADVDEDDRNFGPQEMFQGFPRRSGLDEIFSKVPENHLVGQELRRLVVDQQDIDLLLRLHWCTRSNDGATS